MTAPNTFWLIPAQGVQRIGQDIDKLIQLGKIAKLPDYQKAELTEVISNMKKVLVSIQETKT